MVDDTDAREKLQDSAAVISLFLLGFVIILSFQSIYVTTNARELIFLWGITLILMGFIVLIIKSAFYPPRLGAPRYGKNVEKVSTGSGNQGAPETSSGQPMEGPGP